MHAGEDGRASVGTEEALRWQAFVRACNPTPRLPLATCIVAAALWTGAAGAERLGCTGWTIVPAMGPVRHACLWAGLTCAAGAAALALLRIGRDRNGLDAWVLTLLGAMALLLGAGLRIREAEAARAIPAIELDPGARDGWAEQKGQLVRLRATVRTRPAPIAEGSDQLARYFMSPPRVRFEVDEVAVATDSLDSILESHGITFIGPKSDHIKIMGDKIEAKRTAKKLGIPCVPGSD